MPGWSESARLTSEGSQFRFAGSRNTAPIYNDSVTLVSLAATGAVATTFLLIKTPRNAQRRGQNCMQSVRNAYFVYAVDGALLKFMYWQRWWRKSAFKKGRSKFGRLRCLRGGQVESMRERFLA